MRMSRRTGLYGAGIKDLYLFNKGAVPGFTWTPAGVTNYAGTRIGTVLEAYADINQGESREGVHASLKIDVDVTRYRTIRFSIDHKGSEASITVDGQRVSGGAGDRSIDVSAMTGVKSIYLNSGTINKPETQTPRVSSSITVSRVWMSKR